MWPEARAAINVGVFGIILIGLCSLSFGLLSRLVSLDPIVYFASMAGVMTPMVMVMAGALAQWASQNPGLLAEQPRGGAHEAVLPSLIAGLMTACGSALMFLLALAAPLDGVFPSARPWILPRKSRHLRLPGGRRAAGGLRGPVGHRRRAIRHYRARDGRRGRASGVAGRRE